MAFVVLLLLSRRRRRLVHDVEEAMILRQVLRKKRSRP
jgi:hypothetical protein